MNFDQDIAFCGTGRYPEPLEDFEVGSGSGVDSASSLIRPSPQNHRLPHPRHNRDDSSSSQHVRMSKGRYVEWDVVVKRIYWPTWFSYIGINH